VCVCARVRVVPGAHVCPLGREHRSRSRWRRPSRTALKCCTRRTRAITRMKRLR
jgi:ferredoxin